MGKPEFYLTFGDRFYYQRINLPVGVNFLLKEGGENNG